MPPELWAMPLLGEISKGYFQDFSLIHMANGLYVAPYYPELPTRPGQSPLAFTSAMVSSATAFCASST